jgi:hypothetical protein
MIESASSSQSRNAPSRNACTARDARIVSTSGGNWPCAMALRRPRSSCCRPLRTIVVRHIRRYLVELVTQQSAHDHIEHRDQQQAGEGREQHTADHAGPDFMTRRSARTR